MSTKYSDKDNNIPCVPVQWIIVIRRNFRRKEIHRVNQYLKFIRCSITNGIDKKNQPNLKEKANPSILKSFFWSRTDPFFFTSNAPGLVEHWNELSWVFPALKLTSYYQPQFSVLLFRLMFRSELKQLPQCNIDMLPFLDRTFISSRR